jgi:hypothetical protein
MVINYVIVCDLLLPPTSLTDPRKHNANRPSLSLHYLQKNSYQTLKFVKCTAHFDNFYRSSLNNYSIFEPQF